MNTVAKLLLACALAAALQPLLAEAPAKEPILVQIAGAPAYELGFDTLAGYPYTIVDAGTGASPAEIEAAQKNDQVPDWVRFYDGKRVLLTGYMLPLSIEDGRTTKFIIMKDVTTCCYGATPSMNDYAIVSMKDRGAEVIQDVPVELLGTLSIDPRYEDGYIVSLYLIHGETMLGAKD